MPVSDIVASTNPTIYIRKRRSIYWYNGRTRKGSEIGLATWARKAGSLKPLVVRILSRLLPRLSDLAISFRLHGLEIEQDVEIPTWKYAVVEVGLDWRGAPETFDRVDDYLTDYIYSFLSPDEATQVLVVFERVQP
ncbi:MAG: hypothetical protein HY671_13240 [Chloroflexi bacterium]|nr:hypothetical protein [Chloroflexota bacterium]